MHCANDMAIRDAQLLVNILLAMPPLDRVLDEGRLDHDPVDDVDDVEGLARYQWGLRSR